MGSKGRYVLKFPFHLNCVYFLSDGIATMIYDGRSTAWLIEGNFGVWLHQQFFMEILLILLYVILFLSLELYSTKWPLLTFLPITVTMQFNCFSLNSIGPTVELVTGPKRFLAVYFTSALAGIFLSLLPVFVNSCSGVIAVCFLFHNWFFILGIVTGSVMSYCYCQSPSVGASGAIFGLVCLVHFQNTVT